MFTPRAQTQLRRGCKLLASLLQVLDSFVEIKVFKLLLSFNSARAGCQDMMEAGPTGLAASCDA